MIRAFSIAGAIVFSLLVPAMASAETPPPAAIDLTPQFRSAMLPIANLAVYEIGGIVLIRGNASDRSAAEQIGVIARSLGYDRVANLVKVVPPPDDAAIRRAAERELAMHRSLDGCRLRVESHDGVVHVAGTVAAEVQKDEVVALLRNVDGVRDVQADLKR